MIIKIAREKNEVHYDGAQKIKKKDFENIVRKLISEWKSYSVFTCVALSHPQVDIIINR